MGKKTFKIFIILSFLFSTLMTGASSQHVRFLTKIEPITDDRGKILFYSIVRRDPNEQMIKLDLDAQQMAAMKNFDFKDQVIIEGELVHQFGLEGESFNRLKASRIVPISLARLGVPLELNQAPLMMVQIQSIPYGTLSFTASTEVITTIILTSAFLMFNTMMTESNSGNPKDALNNALFTGAGALALGAFIFKTN